MVTWQRELGERDDVGEAAPHIGLGPDEVVATGRGDAVASIFVGITVGAVLVVVLWLVAVWTVRS